MDHAAVSLMREYPDIVLGFGQSDEYRWVSQVDDPTRVPLLTVDPQSAFCFANPRCCTTDGDQNLRPFSAPGSLLHTLCIGTLTFLILPFLTPLRLMHASSSIPGQGKFGTTFRGVKPIVRFTLAPSATGYLLIAYQPT